VKVSCGGRSPEAPPTANAQSIRSVDSQDLPVSGRLPLIERSSVRARRPASCDRRLHSRRCQARAAPIRRVPAVIAAVGRTQFGGHHPGRAPPGRRGSTLSRN